MTRKNNGIDLLNKTIMGTSRIVVAWFDAKLNVLAITTFDSTSAAGVVLEL